MNSGIFKLFSTVYYELLPSDWRPRTPIHIEDLKAKLKDHEKWLTSEKTEGHPIRLAGKRVAHFDFSGKDLTEAHFTNCDLTGCRFAPARDILTEYKEANRNVTKPAKLTRVSFDYSTLRGAAFAAGIAGEHTNDVCDVSGASFIGTSGMYDWPTAFIGHGLRFSYAEPPRFKR